MQVPLSARCATRCARNDFGWHREGLSAHIGGRAALGQTLAYGKGGDTETRLVGAGSLSFCRFLWFLVVILLFPAGFPALPDLLFLWLCFCRQKPPCKLLVMFRNSCRRVPTTCESVSGGRPHDHKVGRRVTGAGCRLHEPNVAGYLSGMKASWRKRSRGR